MKTNKVLYIILGILFLFLIYYFIVINPEMKNETSNYELLDSGLEFETDLVSECALNAVLSSISENDSKRYCIPLNDIVKKGYYPNENNIKGSIYVRTQKGVIKDMKIWLHDGKYGIKSASDMNDAKKEKDKYSSLYDTCGNMKNVSKLKIV